MADVENQKPVTESGPSHAETAPMYPPPPYMPPSYPIGPIVYPQPVPPPVGFIAPILPPEEAAVDKTEETSPETGEFRLLKPFFQLSRT